MDEQQLETLLNTLEERISSKFLSEVDKKIGAFAAKSDREVKKILESKFKDFKPATSTQEDEETETENTSNRPTLKAHNLELQALKQQLETLSKERELDKSVAIKAQRSKALTEYAANSNLLAPSLFTEVMMNKLGDSLQEESGTWYVKQGEEVKKLSEYTSEFLASDGKLFVSAPSTNGAGSSTPKTTTMASKTTSDPTWETISKNLSQQ